jgi:hypothetical protein
MPRIIIAGEVPQEDVASLLQLIRDWDNARPDRHLTIAVDTPELTLEEARAILERLDPEMPHIWEQLRPPDLDGGADAS